MLTPRRTPSHELLDEPDAPRADMERSLRDLRRFNRYLGGIAIYRRLVRRFERAASVLDVGAGSCDNIDSLRDVRLRVALDFNIAHLLYLRDGSGVRRVVGDATRLPFRNDAVDVVTSAHFFHHFSPDANAAILGEALRVARNGVAVNDTQRHYVPLLFVQLLAALRLIGRITRVDAPASVRQGYTVREAEEIAARVPAARRAVVRLWPFRMGILLWRA